MILTIACGAWVCFAQSPEGRSGLPATRSAPAAEDLKLMLLDRPPVPVIAAKDAEPPKPARPDLPADGTMVIDRDCSLEYEPATGWFILRFPPAAGLHAAIPRRVLQSELLEQMEKVVAENPDAAFKVSGETTVYMDRCFLLPRKVTVVDSGLVLAASDAEKAGTEVPADRPDERPGDGVSSQDILEQLMADDPGRPLVPPSVPASGRKVDNASVAPVKAAPIIDADGMVVVDRLVRILPERAGGWLVARFESDNTLQDPPVRLLPCAVLAEAEKLREVGKGQLAKLRVSGELTWYRGRRYLLLRNVLAEREMGQL